MLSTAQSRFTGKERDSETGLDYFGARYYGSTMGRFLSPDEFAGGPVDAFGGDPAPPGPLTYADITNPQSLNKYSYTYNNPLRYIDPDGHLSWDAVKEVGRAFSVRLTGGLGWQWKVKVGPASATLGAGLKGELKINSKGIGLRAVADAGARVAAGAAGIGPAGGVQVKTIQDSKPIENPKVESSASAALQESDGTRISANTKELGVGIQASAAGGIAGVDVAVNVEQFNKGVDQVKTELKQDFKKLMDVVRPPEKED